MGYTKKKNVGLMCDPLMDYIEARNKQIEDPKDVQESQEWFTDIIVDYALDNGLIPAECFEWVEIDEYKMAKMLMWKEC